ncbi:MAG TPA: polysaccharide biosynthesis/export family protein [Gemmatimonadaceae bacterium]|nr:polysaccharide biosynthesis/export family protein [Gemmatimonadaceae bacterium]
MPRSTRLFALCLTLATFARAARAQNPVPEPHAVTDVVVRPGDILRIKFWPEQQYSGDYQVETSGTVAIPLLGELNVSDKTLSEVRNEVRDHYRALTTNGVAIVSLQFRVSVLGQVARPGLYPVDATQSVFDALSQAGGPSTNADLSRIRLLRHDHVVVLDAEQAIQTGAPMLSVLLESGDRIIVPAKHINWFTWQNVLTALQTVGLIVALARHP